MHNAPDPPLPLPPGSRSVSPRLVAHVVLRHAEPIRHKLGECRLQPLPYRHRPGSQNQRAIGSARRSVAWSFAGRRNGPPATSMQLHRPMPRSLPRAFGFGAARGEAVELRQLRRLLHVAFEFAAIVGEGQRGLVRHRLGRDQVAAAQLVRTDAKLARGDIDDAARSCRSLRDGRHRDTPRWAPCWSGCRTTSA